MDYSWLAVVKKSLESIDILANQLKQASATEIIEETEIRTLVGEIEDNTARISRLLSSDKNREVVSKYHISPHELYILIAHVDDDTRKSLLRGDRKILNSYSERLSESTRLWRERIIQPIENESTMPQKDEVKKDNINDFIPGGQVLILLGAGASKPLGIPTMNDFWQIIQAYSYSEEEKIAMNMLLQVAKDETTHLPPDLEKVLGMLDRYEEYFRILWGDPRFGLPNFHLEYSLPYQAFPPWTREKPLDKALRHCGRTWTGISRLKDKVIQIMDAAYTQQLKSVEVLNLYEPILTLLNDRIDNKNIPIFTTNYDNVIEQYCKYGNIKLIDGFQRTGPSLIWNPSEYYQRQDPTQKAITLFKLHGSLTWRKIGNEIIEFGLEPKNISGDKAVIYPTETKEYPYEEPFKTSYKMLSRFLEAVKVVIVIGYSFRDRGITNIIEEAQVANPKLNFIVICGENPGQDTINRIPYGGKIIKFNFEPGKNSNYLMQLQEIMKM